LENLVEQRLFSRDWFAYVWKGQTNIDPGAIAVGDDTVWQTQAGDAANTAFALAPPGLHIVTDSSGGDIVTLQADRAAVQIGSVATFWATNAEIGMMARLHTGPAAADVHNALISVGLWFNATTGADPTGAANIAAAMWHVNNGATAGTWRAITNSGSADPPADEFDTGDTLTTDTVYDLGVFLDESRRPHFFFNDSLLRVGPPLPDTDSLTIPSIAVNESAAEATEFAIQYLFHCIRWLPRAS
jgi:hypothetical protein